MTPYSVYVHIPFCRHRCAYCDFNTYTGLDNLIPDYVCALVREIEILASSTGVHLPVHTIFFGGGTPSLLPPAELERILSTLGTRFNLQPELEVTLEANPGTIDLAYLRDIRGMGVNRLSLGMQSANPEELHLLERQHDFPDVVRAVEWARQAGFSNLNLDLIFGLPDQPIESWSRTLSLALGLHTDHLSLYALTLEHGTPMQHWVSRGLLPDPDPDLAADMYELASDRLGEASFSQYEISNWARKYDQDNLMVCHHNLHYWRNQPYLGIGAGAHGYAAGVRTSNVLSPVVYTHQLLDNDDQRIETFPRTPATVQTQPIYRLTEIGETMMMGLRLTQEGVSNQSFQDRFKETLQEVFGPQIERLVGLGLLEWAGIGGDILRLTRRGRLLGNQVFIEFL
jgi:oxygen-independent coproporphyrinogen-3 oxidase